MRLFYGTMPMTPTPPIAPPPAPFAAEPWQKSWLTEYDCDQPTSIPYPRIPLSGLLERGARLFPERPVCTLYGKATSYRALADEARRLATALRHLGIGPGQCVGLMLPNIPDYLAAMQATWLLGGTVLQLSPLMVAEEVDHWLKSTACRVVITLDLLAPLIAGAGDDSPLEHLVLTSLADRVTVWRGFLYRLERYRRNGFLTLPHDEHRHRYADLLSAEPLPQAVAVDPANDVAVIAPTGGTTSSPKAVMLTHRNLIANAMQLRDWVGGEDGQESILGVLPFFHSYGLSVSLLTCWAKAACIHLHPRFEPGPVLNVILERRPDMIPAVPAMLKALVGAMQGRHVDLSFVKHVISGASALAFDVRRDIEATGVQELVEGYGLTEASPVTHVNPPGARNRPGTIGIPLPDTEAKVIDPDTGEELGDGAVGELLVRGPQVMKGYYNNPDATAEVLRDGWLHTGDMVRRDADGYYTIVDRKRDIIKTSGFLVYPAEVEEVLRGLEAVADAAVIGMPDADRGERVKALLVPRHGVELDLAAVEQHCKQHLGKHKRPREYEIVRELPKNFLGKVLRRKLRTAAPTPH
jgi:long-chain acyl-CoA synthetase